MGQPTYVINCSQWTSPIEIRGGQTIKGYEEGQLIKAWASGGILILDELPKLDPNTAGLLNEALADAAMQPTYVNGVVDESTIPTITNGRGEKIMKGQDCTPEILGKKYEMLTDKEKAKWNSKDDYVKYYQQLKFRFCVIGTGNTDMMTVGNQYSGNQKQYYSLVDRLAGSYYEIKQDLIQEKLLTYDYVYNVSQVLRDFLEKNKAPQSISIRTMLNFNRTYEQQMLYSLGESPFADEIFGSDGTLIPPKSVQASLISFIGMLEENLRKKLLADQNYINASSSGWEKVQDSTELRPDINQVKSFINEFEVKYHLNPVTGKELTKEELKAIGVDVEEEEEDKKAKKK
jgi:cobaltochelatase CobS